MKLVIASILTFLACAPVTPPPQEPSRVGAVTLAAETAGPGRIRLILQNGFDGPVGYNLCTSALERRQDGTWVNVPTDDVCTMELRSLPAGQDATFEKRLPSGIAAGEYRYVTSVEIPVGDPQTRVATPGFQVR